LGKTNIAAVAKNCGKDDIYHSMVEFVIINYLLLCVSGWSIFDHVGLYLLISVCLCVI